MCLIIVKPAGVAIANKQLKKIWHTNSDGFGCAWKEGKTLWAAKTRSRDRASQFMHALRDTLAVFHFRLATHGAKSDRMCHPFVIADCIDQAAPTKEVWSTRGAVVFHNGVISGYGDREISDTAEFVMRLLSRTPRSTHAEICELTCDRFALWYADQDKPQLIGHWQDALDCKVSNLYWRGSYGGKRIKPISGYWYEDRLVFEDEKDEESYLENWSVIK